jgi:voltage-gated potassium channel
MPPHVPNAPISLTESQRRTRYTARWRWPLVGVLLLTIPAFYAELLAAAPAPWSQVVYLAAAVAMAASMARAGWGHRPSQALLQAHALDLLLVAGLLAAALGPASSTSPVALILRLVVAFMTLARMVQALRHWVTRGGVVYLMAVACGVLLLCGAGFWWLEPRTPTLADGLWLAFTTAATVGYGDVVPSTPASRIFSVFVVLLGYGVLTLATAAIATTWIETEERRIEREILGDLRRQVHSLHAEIAALRAELRQGLHRTD